MCLVHLVEARNDIQNRICTYVISELTNLMVLGETMAECATNIQGQGYNSFILAREKFLDEVKRLQEEIDSLNMSTQH